MAQLGQRLNGFFITRQMFDDLDNIIMNYQNSRRKFRMGMDLMVKLMAYYCLGRTQYWSLGPRIGPWRGKSALSYRLPVGRRTGEFFASWQVERKGIGRYSTFNPSRAAWAVEYGINERRIRRPVLKNSVIDTFRFIETTDVARRFWPWVFQPVKGKWNGPLQASEFETFANRIINSSVLKQLDAMGELVQMGPRR